MTYNLQIVISILIAVILIAVIKESTLVEMYAYYYLYSLSKSSQLTESTGHTLADKSSERADLQFQ